MTETFAYGTTSNGTEEMRGSVGVSLPGNEISFSDDGEILLRNPCMMRGYYKEPEKTAAAMQDGYYHTGDTGSLDDNGYLHLTGRVSEVFKTSKGKFVKPLPLENKLNELNVLGQICVMGHGMDQPVALARLAESSANAQPKEISKQLQSKLAALNTELPPSQRIRHIFMVSEEWTIENELLTPTMKIKRNAVHDKYQDWVEQNMEAEEAIIWE